MNYNSDYLMHHGIKGQKWGVRRYQNSDGSLTTAGLHRYYGADAKHRNLGGETQPPNPTARVTRKPSSNPSPSKASDTKKSESKSETPKQELSKPRSSPKEIAQHLKNTASYKIARIGDEVLGRNTVDSYLKVNTTLSRIQTNDTFENFAFYATYKKHDVNAYAGMFGKNLQRRAEGEARRARALAKKTGLDEDIQKAKELTDKAKGMAIYKLGIKNTQALKVPSDSNAGRIVTDLLGKDSKFKKDLEYSLDHAKEIMKRPQQQALFNEAKRLLRKDPSMLSDKDRQTIYKALNLTLVNHDETEQAMQKTFYDAMKKNGYSALVDTNDQQYSSYHAHRPMIIFDTDKTELASATKMDPKKIDRLNRIYTTERIFKEATINLPQTLGSAMNLGISAADEYVSNKRDDYLG